MQCSTCKADLSAEARFCASCGAPVSASPGSVNTAGGAYFGGTVSAGRDVVGRDQHIGVQTHTQTGLQGQDLALFSQSFRAVYRQVTMHLAEHVDSDPDLLNKTAQQIEQEAGRGEEADPGAIRRCLNTLARLAPDVLEVAVNALTNPGAAVASAVKVAANAFRGAAAAPEQPPSN